MKHTIQTTLMVLELDGYPAPEPEYRFQPKRQWRLDYAWPALKLGWEVEGGTWQAGGGRHNRGKGYRDDARKYSEAAVLGWRLLRTTSDMVASGEALRLIEEALRGSGVTPRPANLAGHRPGPAT